MKKTQTDLTFKTFSIANRVRCIDGFKHKVEDWDTSDWFLATMGELGEAANVAKKLNRIRDGIIGNKEKKEELIIKLRLEIADTFIYLDLLATHEGIDLEQAIKDAWNKKSEQIGYNVTI